LTGTAPAADRAAPHAADRDLRLRAAVRMAHGSLCPSPVRCCSGGP